MRKSIWALLAPVVIGLGACMPAAAPPEPVDVMGEVVAAPPEPVGVVCDASGNCTLAGG